MSLAIMGAVSGHGSIAAVDLAPYDSGAMVRTATNSTNSRSTSNGFIETLGGADNDTIHRYHPVPIDLSAIGTNGFIEAIFAVTEANTNDADVFCGISDGFPTATTGVFSNTAATFTAGDHFGWNKMAESMFHRTVAVSTSTGNAGATSTVAFASATEYTVRIEWNVTTMGIDMNVYVDGTLLNSAINNFSRTGVNVGFAGIALKATSANGEAIRVEKFVVGNIQA